MDNDNMNDLNEVLFSLQLEGTYYYQDEENEADYFIAYQLIVIVSDEYSDDAEFEIYECLQVALNDENLIFTDVGENSETYRIIGLPEIEFFEFENGNFTLLDNTNIEDAIEFLINMKTINFNGLKSVRTDDIKNFKWVEL